MNSIQDGHKGITLAINALCVTLILAALVFCVWRLAGLMELRYDAEIYYYTLKKFESTGEMFHRTNSQSPTLETLYRPGASVFKFSPLYLTWMLPIIDRLSLDEFYALYCAWQIIFYVAIATFVIWALKPYIGIKKLLFSTALIFLLSYPFYELLRATSVEIFMLCVLVVMWLASHRFPRMAGVMLSYLAVIKIYPAFMLLYFAAIKKRGCCRVFYMAELGF